MWRDCWQETNLLHWARESRAVGRQHGSWISSNKATTMKKTAADFYFFPWSLTRQCWFTVLCQFWLQCSHNLMHICTVQRHFKENSVIAYVLLTLPEAQVTMGFKHIWVELMKGEQKLGSLKELNNSPGSEASNSFWSSSPLESLALSVCPGITAFTAAAAEPIALPPLFSWASNTDIMSSWLFAPELTLSLLVVSKPVTKLAIDVGFWNKK